MNLCPLLRFLPKNHLSYFAGKAAYLELPAPVLRFLIHRFANRYQVRIEDASCDISHYASLGEFFTRDLKPGLRPIGEGVVSPVDGTLVEFGDIENDQILQVKGKSYSVDELVHDAGLASKYHDGFYLTIYLAPGDYHHIHAPVEGRIIDAYHIEGTLWPVNQWSVQSIDNLFCVNERIVTLIESPLYGKVSVVKVGATNVGSISLTYDSLVGNAKPKLLRAHPSKCTHRNFAEGFEVEKGEKIASFRLGSTVILLFEKGRFKPGGVCKKGKLHFGTSLSASVV